MNELLSQVVADLFDKSKGELSPKIQYLHNEIKKIIESENTVFGKLRGLTESFQEIIPDEKQRYNAAIKALSTTSKLSREEIVKAVNDQLEELKILEKGLVPAVPDWRNELKAMEATTLEIRGEITKLRERMVWLESEEKRILTGMATRQKEVELAEKAMRELFADIGAEITTIKKKVEEFTAERAAPQPIPQKAPAKTDTPAEKKEVGVQKNEIKESFVPQDTEWQKKCPMCGGRMDFYSQENKWQCYSCAYEELEEEKAGNEPAPASAPIIDQSPPPAVPWAPPSSKESQPPTKKKTCPVCRKKMQWYEMETAWRCPSCDYERRI